MKYIQGVFWGRWQNKSKSTSNIDPERVQLWSRQYQHVSGSKFYTTRLSWMMVSIMSSTHNTNLVQQFAILWECSVSSAINLGGFSSRSLSPLSHFESSTERNASVHNSTKMSHAVFLQILQLQSIASGSVWQPFPLRCTIIQHNYATKQKKRLSKRTPHIMV